MRDAPGPLKAFLAARTPCFKADLFTLTLADGSTDRWTTFDQPVSYSGQVWMPGGPNISRADLSVRNTMEVPQLTVEMRAPQNFLYRERPIRENIISGILNGAILELDRTFMPKTAPGDASAGIVLMFLGKKSGLKQSGDIITLKIKGGNVTLNQRVPKNLWMTSCLHTFCNPGCTLHEADFTIPNTVGAGTSASTVVWGALPADPTVYSLGKIIMTSGASAGIQRAIRLSTNAGILLSTPFDYGVAVGDTFNAVQGCNRTMTRCNQVANIQHYRGFPFVPPATMAV